MKTTKYRKWAEGKPCQVRISGVCNHDKTTTVLAHLNGGKSLNSKNNDIFSALACSSCHDVIDGKKMLHGWTWDDVRLTHYEGWRRTLVLALEDGLITTS